MVSINSSTYVSTSTEIFLQTNKRYKMYQLTGIRSRPIGAEKKHPL